MIRLRDKFTLASRLRYLMWRTGAIGRKVTVRLTSGEQIILSGLPYELGTAYQIFIAGVYRCPKPIERNSIRRIVDVGANVGHSIVYWAGCFPESRIDAFEPHPTHLDRLTRTVALNGWGARVTVHAAAAGTANETARLVDRGTASAVFTPDHRASQRDEANAVPIQIVDFFDEVGDGRIDLLKFDCEGAEFDLLMDPRFAQLEVRNLVMEWHETPAHPTAERDLSERLRGLGWELRPRPEFLIGPLAGTELMRAGILWAFAPAGQARD